MITIIQRVKECEVGVKKDIVGKISHGILVLLGVEHGDTKSEADYLVDKLINLRIFEDNNGKMNHSLLDVKGQIMVVSQFTLLGDCRKGRRPSFVKAAPPDIACTLYEYFVEKAKVSGLFVQTGIFGAMMDVSLVNDGPVTLIVKSK